jgi:signal transduction histidine kinase
MVVRLLLLLVMLPASAAAQSQRASEAPADTTELPQSREAMIGQVVDGDTLLMRYRFDREESVVLYASPTDSLEINYTLFRVLSRMFASFDTPEPGSFTAGVAVAGSTLRLWLEYSKYALMLLVALVLALIVLIVKLRRSRRAEREAVRERERTIRIRRYAEQSREDERRRLARELHDGPLQTLYALRMNLALVHQNPEQHDATVGEIADELRGLTNTLRSPLSGYGLGEALRTLAERHRETTGMRVHLDIDSALQSHSDGDPIGEPQATAFFRLTQEALSNAARHSQAENVRIQLHRRAIDGREGVALVVEDDGMGFRVPDQLEDLGEAGHYGLVGQQERADVLGGEFFVWSEPGQGTRMSVWIPLRVSQPTSEPALLDAA